MNEIWKPLFKAGAFAAIAVVALVPLQILVFGLAPPPEDALSWMVMFEESKLLGLMNMDLLMIADNLLIAVTILAVCIALRDVSPSFTSLALFFTAIAVPTYFASNPAFEMAALSDKYWAAPDAEQQTALLAAAELLIASWQGTAFDVSYVLTAIVALVISAVMLKSPIFGKPVAYAGLVFGAASLVPASAGTVGLALSLFSLVPMLLWLTLIASRLLVLSRDHRRAVGGGLAPVSP